VGILSTDRARGAREHAGWSGRPLLDQAGGNPAVSRRSGQKMQYSWMAANHQWVNPLSPVKVPNWGPFWDHTLCAVPNDLRVYERHTRRPPARRLPTTCRNALPLLTGGQVVAGSNPVSPTSERLSEQAFFISSDCTHVRLHPKLSQIVTSNRMV